jgi:hypothetical protein
VTRRLVHLGDHDRAQWVEDLPDGKRLIGPVLTGPALLAAQLEVQAQLESQRRCDEAINAALAAPSPQAPSYRSPGLSARMALHSNSDLATRWASGLVTPQERSDWGDRLFHPELDTEVSP